MIDTNEIRKYAHAAMSSGLHAATHLQLLCDILDELRAIRDRMPPPPPFAPVSWPFMAPSGLDVGAPVGVTRASCQSCGWVDGHAPLCPVGMNAEDAPCR